MDSTFMVERVDTIRKVAANIPAVKSLDRTLDSMSNGKRQLYIWVLPQAGLDANVRISEKWNNSYTVYDYYYINPYTLEYSRIQY